MRTGGLGNALTSQHAGDFVYPRVPKYRPYGAGDAVLVALLTHQQVVVGAGRYLWQVGHAKHLAVLPETTQQTSHSGGHGAADATIDFIEHQGGRTAQLACRDCYGQCQAGQLAAGGHAVYRTGRAAGVPGH